MAKGIVVTALVIFIVLIIGFIFLMGVSSNWKPVYGDVLGVVTFFNALRDTIGNSFFMLNYVTWLMIFFGVQVVVVYVYYRVARIVWVHIPQIRKWIDQTKGWFS